MNYEFLKPFLNSSGEAGGFLSSYLIPDTSYLLNTNFA